MKMQSETGRQVAAQLVAALTALGELDKVSAIDAEMIWQSLVAHVRSARPQALLSLKEVP